MGFWDSFVEGSKAAGGWVLENAGDLQHAVATVSKLAAVDEAGETSQSPETQLERFHTNFKFSSYKLQQRAKQKSNNAGSSSSAQRAHIDASEFHAKNVNEDKATGVWKSPTSLLDGKPAVHMYQDLSRWLAALGVPPSSTADVASSAAQALFLGSGNAAHAQIYSTSFAYADPEGQWTLDCGHAYYPIPMGASPNDICWHSCIYAKFSPSDGHVATRRPQGTGPAAPLALRTAVSRAIKTDAPAWVVNATINWGSAAVAGAVYKRFLENWCNSGGGTAMGRSILSSNLLGVSQYVQMQGNAHDSPTTIRQSIISSAAETVSRFHVKAYGLADRASVAVTDAGSTVDRDEYENGYGDRDEDGDDSGSAGMARMVLSSGNTTTMPVVVPEVDITKSQIVFMKER